MNLGGEPERDDSGLPPVDIEIPDDARELDRDVQAYRRELRALRRHQRRKRLGGPMMRDGVVLPLLASCLVLALIAGTLLTVFTAGPGGDLPGTIGAVSGRPTSGASGPVGTKPGGSGSASPGAAAGAPSDSPIAVLTRAKLPDKAVEIGGARVPLRTLTRSVLALVPADCGCAGAVASLVGQAAKAGVRIFLVGGGKLAAVRQLTAQAPHPAVVADDVSGTLGQSYRHSGLTALLVHPDGTVGIAAPLAPGFVLTSQLRALRSPATTPAAGHSTPPPGPVS